MHNLFYISYIDIIEDVKGVIKNTLFIISCIKIMPPTLEEWKKRSSYEVYKNEFNHTFISSPCTTFGGTAKMIVNIHPAPLYIGYNVEDAVVLLFFINTKSTLSNTLDIDRIYWNNLVSKNQLNVHNKIHPIYYFI